VSRLAFVALLVGSIAHAHTGGQPVNAIFSTPPAPVTTPADMELTLSPYTFPSADAGFLVEWTDGDTDPTGLFTFYYMPYQPTFAVTPEEIENGLAKLAAEAGKPGQPVHIWASCSCDADAGVVCPDAGVRDCRNSFMWDTSVLPDGTYWIVAVNNDPPFKLYNPASAPVRVAHGAAELPPAVIVFRPDGFGSFDTSYKTQWYAVGKAPLTIDLFYGSADDGQATGPVTALAAGVMAPLAADGTQAFDWDVTGLESLRLYYLRVRVTDGNGKISFSDSRYALSVYHPGKQDLSAQNASDMSADQMPMPEGCGCRIGRSGTAWSAWLVAALAAIAALLLARRRC
jgi:MYXO-CTERM domain-containing protein